MGRRTIELIASERVQQRDAELMAYLQAGNSWSGEILARRRDGMLLPTEVTMAPMFDARGQPTHIIGVSFDITERNQAEEALQKSEEAYRNLVEDISDVIYSVDAEGVITYLNPAVEALIGLPPEQVVGQPFAQFIHPEDLGRLQENVQDLFSGLTPGPAEYRVLNASGETRWIRVASQPSRDGDRITGVQGVLSDITERKKVEEQLEEAATAAERQRLARELHDSVTQSLYGLDLLANAAQQTLAAGKIERASEHVREILSLSQSALADMRLLIFELRPPLLEQEGLAGALRARLGSVEGRAGLRTRFDVQGESPLSPTVEAELYAVALEALNNTLKHARAEHITLNLEYDGGRCYLTIQDDGVGFDSDMAESGGGLGLHTMRERVERLGGNLTLDTVPGRGTTIRVEVTA
jgi:PAS domain S-box-containing protein